MTNIKKRMTTHSPVPLPPMRHLEYIVFQLKLINWEQTLKELLVCWTVQDIELEMRSMLMPEPSKTLTTFSFLFGPENFFFFSLLFSLLKKIKTLAQTRHFNVEKKRGEK